VFVIIRYLKKNALMKAGSITCIMGLWIAVGNYLGWIVIYEYQFHTHILVVALLAGFFLFAIGIIKDKMSV